MATAIAAGACAGSSVAPTGGPDDSTGQARPADAPGAGEVSSRLLDDFESIAGWKTITSDGVSARLVQAAGQSGQALRLDFDFGSGSGYAIAQRALPIDLPDNYEFSFALRGQAPHNTFEFKLLDESGDNVWWSVRRDYQFPEKWQRIAIKKRHIDFAWGTTADRTLRRVAAIEFVVSTGSGGSGSIYIDRFRFRKLPPRPDTWPTPTATASSVRAGDVPARAVDGRTDTAWASDPAGGQAQTFTLDLGLQRELGGVFLHWQKGVHASRYDIELSDDGTSWQRQRRVEGGNGGRDPIHLPESEARYLRLRLHEGPSQGYALAEVDVQEVEVGVTPSAFVQAVAKDSPRGHFPRGMSGEQPYWTVVGIDGGGESGLLSEDGAVELYKGGVSLEPFVRVGSRLTTWADVTARHSLRGGYLPIPSVTWRHPAWNLRITAFATGSPEKAQLVARYTVENSTADPLSLELLLAVRPLQVNPPTQFLAVQGGVSPIEKLAWKDDVMWVDGTARVHPLTPPDRVGLTRFDSGAVIDTLDSAQNRAAQRIDDPTGLASGGMIYALDVAPGASATVAVVAPLSGTVTRPRLTPETLAAWLDEQENQLARAWSQELGHVSLQVPPQGQPIVDTVRSALAQILMSRQGVALQPGTRSYNRSWIRDGAMISEALLRLGHADLAKAFLRWFARYQYESGKVPCCVGPRGADPVPENDSHGQLIFLAAEIYRFTRDRALLEEMWPRVEGAVRYMDALRQAQQTGANREPDRRALYGLLEPSISHEGYPTPAYSYWDNFWGLVGYKDAVAIAGWLGRDQAKKRLAQQESEFRRDLYASIQASVAAHEITYIPGAAEHGDFDATSTTIALAPCGEQHHLPQDLLLATFERYWQHFVARRDGTVEWAQYTPYELRTVSTFIRLGWRDRVDELLAFFFADRRPAAWNQWAEVVGRDPRDPRFIGDMPHAWVASDYIRSALDMFAYARPADEALVLAAGLPVAWLDAGKPPIGVTGLRTRYGSLDYSLSTTGRRVVLRITGSAKPPGGFVFAWPWPDAPGSARIGGKRVPWRDGELRVRSVPATIVISRP